LYDYKCDQLMFELLVSFSFSAETDLTFSVSFRFLAENEILIFGAFSFSTENEQVIYGRSLRSASLGRKVACGKSISEPKDGLGDP